MTRANEMPTPSPISRTRRSVSAAGTALPVVEGTVVERTVVEGTVVVRGALVGGGFGK